MCTGNAKSARQHEDGKRASPQPPGTESNVAADVELLMETLQNPTLVIDVHTPGRKPWPPSPPRVEKSQEKDLIVNMCWRHQQLGLSVAAAVGVGLYVILDVVAQLQPPHYSFLHQPESDLGVGPHSLIMNINFIVRGLTALALAARLLGQPLRRRQRAGVLLIGTWGVCSALLSVFHTDITTGPLASDNTTPQGNVHLALAFAGFLAASIGTVLLGPTIFSRTTHVRPLVYAPLAMFVVFVAAAATTDLFGLFERVFIAAVLLWTAVVAAERLRTEPNLSCSGGPMNDRSSRCPSRGSPSPSRA